MKIAALRKTLTPFRFLGLGLLAILFSSGIVSELLAQGKRQTEKPNVIVILTDDQGWGDLSLNGNTNLSTPNIDGMAKEGAMFDRFYVCPVCSPTRAEFLTGRYHPRSGVYSTSAGGERMDLDEMTIAQTFKAAGYHTAAYGKWHNGMQYPYHPNGRGFDDYFGFCSGHWGHYFDWMLEHNGELVKGNGFCIDDFTDHAIHFMEEHRDEPFFIYLPYNTPHSPMQVPDRFWNKFKDKELSLHNREPNKENLQHIRAALAMCENIDWNVGRLTQKLEELKLTEETIVVYFCDNGPNGVRWNGDMKGRKGSTDEGGVRSPLIVRWPGTIKPGTEIQQNAAAIDLLPTLADLAEIPVQSKKQLDGVSLKRLLLGEQVQWLDRIIFSHWRNRVSARTQQFRLDQQGALFDINKDPGQYKNVASQYPEETKRLKAAVDKWKKKVLAGYDDDQRPFVIGHPDFANTQIPARDGKEHGNIKRSNRFPNCSYFTNWLSTEDKITWDVEVAAAGEFEVELYYTCAAKDLGCEMELRLGDASVASTITTANDPPVVGAAEDRVKRQESYVKDFRPHHMGHIKLSKGSGQLSLHATKIPGDQAIEFRLLMLKRVE